MKIFFLPLLFYLNLSAILFFSTPTAAQCSAGSPVVSIGIKTACSVQLTWPPVPNAAFYDVKYKVDGADNWADTISIGSATSVIVDGLLSGTKYKFNVTSYCENNDKGASKSITAKTKTCSVPVVISVVVNPDFSVYVDWDGCTSNFNSIRYRLLGTSAWTTINTGGVSSATITGLTQNSVYEYQVKACSGSSSQNWSPVSTFTISVPLPVTPPNIILLLLDDGRYDTYLPSGGPDFFNSPSINRIANEGANFKNFFVTLSICNPSRATILTGLLPTHHNVRANKDSLSITLPTYGSILNSYGYYTAFLGKYPSIYYAEPRPGWNYWMASIAGEGEHNNGDFNINGTEKEIIGYKTTVLTDTAVRIINSINSKQPFCITLSFSAVHEVTQPAPGDDGIFDNETMPVPATFFSPYTQNYPSLLDLPKRKIPTYDSAAALWRGMFEMLKSVDDNAKRIFDTLTARNLLENTMIMFTSDNGYLLGEHQLKGKSIPYEASMRVPMFIRYPAWFAPGTVVDSSLALNVDILQTMLDAAKIPDNYNLDGISMHAQATGSIRRNMFYFIAGDGIILNTVRTKRYKLNRYLCKTETMEFFDLQNDPEENTNLINKSEYASLIDAYELILDSLKLAVGDTKPFKKDDCYLVNPVYEKDEEGMLLPPEGSFTVYPTLSDDLLHIDFEQVSSATINIYTLSGQLLLKKNYDSYLDGSIVTFKLNELPAGVYMLSIETAEGTSRQKIIVQ